MDYDLAVIGGGINGLAITRDAAARGLRVVLLERDDVGCETSSWSSRMIHGGLRYLEQLDLRLVRESLQEREILFQTASHLVRPMRIVIPVFRDSTRRWATIRVGMLLYDLLSYGKSVPRHTVLKRDRVIDLLPGMRSDGLIGAVAYTDGQVELSERLCVELALDAEQRGAVIRTKTAATSIEIIDGRAVAVLTDGEAGSQRIKAGCIVNATGPWVDRLVPEASLADPLVGGTKGSHIVLPEFPGAPASTVHFETEAGKPLLCIPMQSNYLIGSTDELFSGDPVDATISERELRQLIAAMNRLFPSARITRDDVLVSYAGVRPLPHAPGKAATAITRRHRIHQHAPQAPNLFSIIGGKLTTHRRLAEETVDQVARQLGRKLPKSPTATLSLPGSGLPDELAKRRRTLERLGLETDVSERLLRLYGILADRVIELASTEPRLARRLCDGSSVIAAEVLVAVDQERARSLADVVFRRLAAGFDPQLDAITAVAGRLLVEERGWSTTKLDGDTEEVRRLAARMGRRMRTP